MINESKLMPSLEFQGFGFPKQITNTSLCMNWDLDYTVKPVLRGHSKIDKTKILMTDGSLCNEGRKYCRMLPLLGAFCNNVDLH